MDDFEKELKEGFLEESADLLQSAEGAFLRLESNANDVDLINQIFRLAHNLKGTSRAVGFGDVAELTHHAENLILKIKNQEIVPTPPVVSLLLEFNDRVNDMINGLKENLEARFENQDLIAKLEVAIAGGLTEAAVVAEEVPEESAPAATTEEFVEPEAPSAEMSLEEAHRALAEMDACGASVTPANYDSGATEKLSARDQQESQGSSIDLSEADLNELAQLGSGLAADSAVPVPNDRIEQDVDAFLNAPQKVVLQKAEAVKSSESVKPIPQSAGDSSSKKTAPATKAKEDESIRVSIGRIEKLNNIVGELVILQTVLDQRRFSHIQDELSNKSIGQLGKLSKEIQELSMSLRMVPIKSTFQKMTRIVRDTSKALNKQVNLQILGEETEIDKTILEKIGDPLVHVVRNAIDHGLETPEERVAAGKSSEGLCEIKAFHEGSNLVIQVRDDGKGINPAIIRKKAIEKGVIKESARLSDHELIQLIFHPGFSTKEQVTEVSGRGVGMDVVKTNIEGLSGVVNVQSKVGEGSVFKIVLPLTLAIIEGMVVHVAKSRFIVPLAQVHEFVRIAPNSVQSLSDGGRLFKLRDEVLPLFNVSSALGLTVKPEAKDLRSEKIAIIIRATEFPYAVEVDDIVNQQQVVIKALGAEIKSRKGFMGSSILGDGSPVVILDFVDLFAGQLKQNAAYAELVDQRKAA